MAAWFGMTRCAGSEVYLGMGEKGTLGDASCTFFRFAEDFWRDLDGIVP
jgi:hypothetical protein